MAELKKIFLCLMAAVFASCFSESFAETLTLSTYYPAPEGRYQEMRAEQMAVGRNYVLATTTVDPDNLIVEGNLGVGVAVPEAFQVNATNISETSQAVSNVRIGVGDGGASPRIIFDASASVVGGQWEIDSTAGRMRFYQPGVEKMTILSNGNVGVGLVAPGAKLEVNGNVRAADPVNGSDLATKNYVDAAAGGSPGGWTCANKHTSVAGGLDAVATCDTGYKMITGGCDMDIGNHNFVNHPSGNGWLCRGGSGGASQAWARCCQ